MAMQRGPRSSDQASSPSSVRYSASHAMNTNEQRRRKKYSKLLPPSRNSSIPQPRRHSRRQPPTLQTDHSWSLNVSKLASYATHTMAGKVACTPLQPVTT
jgi:hypothetical protein